MISLEINRQTLTDARLSADAAGLEELVAQLQCLLSRTKADLMFTPDSWGEWDGTLARQALSGAPYSVVSVLRLFLDTPEKNFLEGRPAKICVHEEGSELSLIASESALRAMLADLATLQQAGESLCWEIAYASAFLPSHGRERPLPPVRLRVLSLPEG